MFGSNNKNSPKAKAGAADTLICKQTKITGDICFTGVLYVDGHVKGDVFASESENALLTIGTNGFVEGQINVPHIIVLGRVTGDVYASEHIELMADAVIKGNVHYKLIEMAMGAEVNGQMLHSVEKQKLLGHHQSINKKKKKASKLDNDNSNHDELLEEG